MQAITAPISRDEPRENRADIIANLQKALLLLLRGGAIPGGSEEGLQKEQREPLYGDITQQLVRMFQEQYKQRGKTKGSGVFSWAAHTRAQRRYPRCTGKPTIFGRGPTTRAALCGK